MIDLGGRKAPFFDRLTKDVENGTDTAIPFELAYTASKVMVEVQGAAVRLGGIEQGSA